METGIELIAQERAEQIEKHGRTIESDVNENSVFQLGAAASMLLLNKEERKYSLLPHPIGWNEDLWRKMYEKPYKERLIISGALIAAEIDRLNHANEEIMKQAVKVTSA